MLLKLLVTNSFGRISKFYNTQRLAKLITTALFLLLFTIIAVVLYFFFLYGFNYIDSDTPFRLPLTLYTYEIFLIILSGVIIFNAFITGIFSLFRGTDDNWVLSSPSFKALPKFVFIKTVISASWPLLVVFIPALAALSRLHDMAWYGVTLLVFSFILLIAMLTALTLIFIIFVSLLYDWLADKLRIFKLSFRGIVSASLLIGLACVILIRMNIGHTDLIKLFRAQDLEVKISTQMIAENFELLPTHALAMELLAWQNNEISSALYYLMILFIMSAVLAGAWWQTSRRFLFLWQKLQEGSFVADTRGAKTGSKRADFKFMGGQLKAIFKKEALMSVRNTKNLLWFLFLLALLVMQIGVYKVLSRNISDYDLDINKNVAVIQALIFVTAIYFICAFTLRFVFTSFSTERKTAWVLSSAPLRQRRLYFGKFSFYALVFLVIGCLIWFINLSIFSLPYSYTGYSFLIFMISTFFVVTLGYSLGALFPNYKTDDPGVISTTLPGIFFIFSSLSYSALGGWLLYLLLLNNSSIPIILFGIISTIITAVLLMKVPDYVRGRDLA
jgi:hypothetical protein